LAGDEAGDAALAAKLTERYAAMKTAMEAHDADHMRALVTPDYQSIDAQGRLLGGVNELIAAMAFLAPPDPRRMVSSTIVSLKRDGDVATVHQRYDSKTGRKSLDGADHTYEQISLTTDTWVDGEGGWRMQKTQTDELTILVSGKTAMHLQRN
jgi:hypothetical protein